MTQLLNREQWLLDHGIDPASSPRRCEGRCGAVTANFLLVSVAGRAEWPGKDWVCTSCLSVADQLLTRAALNLIEDLGDPDDPA